MSRRRQLLPIIAVIGFLVAPTQGGDILRNGAGIGDRTFQGTPQLDAAIIEEAMRAQGRFQDNLKRSTERIQQIMRAQQEARGAFGYTDNAGENPYLPGVMLPDVPNGLVAGGLEVDPRALADPLYWSGADLPSQSGAPNGGVEVLIRQNQQSAFLNWKTFNIGRLTHLRFDQSAGGADAARWIAFNQVNDPSALPSQILGTISAEGQVYVINRNGVVFGPTAQTNLRGLTVSALPINTNLVERGLLNNPDAQFLFSGLPIAPIAGGDGTPGFDPTNPDVEAPFLPNPMNPLLGRWGDVIVRPGARLRTTVAADGNGGRIMLVGGNVINDGVIATPAGQTILAAGLQVGIQAHDVADTSLRGLDVFVGAVDDPANPADDLFYGTVTNNGLIQTLKGNTTLVGRDIFQNGAIDSSTGVDFSGRIDILAAYGAAMNPNFDEEIVVGSGLPPFIESKTGNVFFGPNSVTRVLPDYASALTRPGLELPERSRINILGKNIYVGNRSRILAPNGVINVDAGSFRYEDTNGDGTIFGEETSGGSLFSIFRTNRENFIYSGGQIYVEEGAIISAAGSTNVFVPLDQNILEVEFRGPEFADSPLQRDGPLRNVPLTVDIRRSGTFGGRFWIGTPLGDVVGLANLIDRNAGQLTGTGGDINLRSGGSIIIKRNAEVDVSGGFFRNEGGTVNTSRLINRSRLVRIDEATPDQIYDGVFTGEFVRSSPRWGVEQTYQNPLMSGDRFEPEYIEGAAGGTLNLRAPVMALDGRLRGNTIQGPRQREMPPIPGELRIAFRGEQGFDPGTGITSVITATASVPPLVLFQSGQQQNPPQEFGLVGEDAIPLTEERARKVFLREDLLSTRNFGRLEVDNPDGDVKIPQGSRIDVPPFGSLAVRAANITIGGNVFGPGASLEFQTYGISPVLAEQRVLLPGTALPTVPEDRGNFILGGQSVLDTSGWIVDDRIGSDNPNAFTQTVAIDGGSVSIDSYNVNLMRGSVIDVSGGLHATHLDDRIYGDGGSITILSGRDFLLPDVTGGLLQYGVSARGYSGATGGSLTVRAQMVQIGGTTEDPRVFLIHPGFFRQGGFTEFNLMGIGAPSLETPAVGEPEPYLPAIRIVEGTRIRPKAMGLLAVPFDRDRRGIQLRRFAYPLALRSPASVSLSAEGADDPFTQDILEIRSDIVMERDTEIRTDPGASVTVDAELVTVLGSIIAEGGAIRISGASAYPLSLRESQEQFAIYGANFARPTVYIGPNAVLDVSGRTILQPDDRFGRRIGDVLPGGTIEISGNLVLDQGALLDASGTRATLDFHPDFLRPAPDPLVPANSGLNSPLWATRSEPYRVDSNGGVIRLIGSELLRSDATLLARRGGNRAVGGYLEIFSGNFIEDGDIFTTADTNLVVEQQGVAIDPGNTNLGVGRPVFDDSGVPVRGGGYFSLSQFIDGGFNSLDLAARFLDSATPLSFGGNVKFVGPIQLNVPGVLRLAGGGAIEADSLVQISARYLQIGQPFRVPNVSQPPVFEERFRPPGQSTLSVREFFPVPTGGTGSLMFDANFVDAGHLVAFGISDTSIRSREDLRGNGTISVAGNLVIRAGQVTPTTLGTFNLFAYADGSSPGRIEIQGTSNREPPYSAGGTLGIYASEIDISGVLRAPFGTITVGWDGSDLNPSTPEIDGPANPVSGDTDALRNQLLGDVILRDGSLLQVSGLRSFSQPLIVPFGVSPDGFGWIDPVGVSVTATGLPTKNVNLRGANVTAEHGSRIDIRGGGDLIAFQWVPGNLGSIDLTGTAVSQWSPAASYEAGDLVLFDGKTWSARGAINVADFQDSATGAQARVGRSNPVFNSTPSPDISPFWSEVPNSYAVLPYFDSPVFPYAPFNNAAVGDPGFIQPNLSIGDRIYLDGSSGLPRGFYTLLPRRYALLPGGRLITPKEGRPIGAFEQFDGSSLDSGFITNVFRKPDVTPVVRSRFEIAPPTVFAERAEYERYFANEFMPAAQRRLNLETLQQLPRDAGTFRVRSLVGLDLQNTLKTGPRIGGRGASAFIETPADLYLIGGAGSAPAGATAVLNTGILQTWGVERFFIGGTSKLVLDNPGTTFLAPDIILQSTGSITVTPGSSLTGFGLIRSPAIPYATTGDGVAIRVSADPGATIVRTDVPSDPGPLLSIGAGSEIRGASVFLDSTYSSAIDPTALIDADNLGLGSGQIAVVFSNPGGPRAGDLIPEPLVIGGSLLNRVNSVRGLTLTSYRSIDFYGDGQLGTGGLETLTLNAGTVRGFGSNAMIETGDFTIANPADVDPVAFGSGTGALSLWTSRTFIGDNDVAVTGFGDTVLSASGGIAGIGTLKESGLTFAGDLRILTPEVTGLSGTISRIGAAGGLIVENFGESLLGEPELGASFTLVGADVDFGSNLRLPSGTARIEALTGDLDVSGVVDVRGVRAEFLDAIRFSPAGLAQFVSDTGDVRFLPGSRVVVSGTPQGGDAGIVDVRSGAGIFEFAGSDFEGRGIDGFEGGVFLLDAGTIPSLGDLNRVLSDGGFRRERNFRIRNGDLVIEVEPAGTYAAETFRVVTDSGDIRLLGFIDASGATGGEVALIASGSVILEPGSGISVRGVDFDSAGKGGVVFLEAGSSVNGVASPGALVDLRVGSSINLGVDSFVPGDATTPGSSAFSGRFQGVLNLRAPRNAANNDFGVAPINGTVLGASAIIAEGYEIIDLTGSGVITGWRPSFASLPTAGTTQRQVYDSASAYLSAGNFTAMMARLLGADPQGLDPLLVLVPGTEIINRTGSLTLGSANSTAIGSAAQNSADWNLADFRFGPRNAPGALTLRARNDLVFFNALSDGFREDNPADPDPLRIPFLIPSPLNPSGLPVQDGQRLWLSPVSRLNGDLPVPAQSWSYRLAAGSDFGSADALRVLELQDVGPDSGSLLLGKIYDPRDPAFNAAEGSNGVTAAVINNRYQVIRTGTGSINVATARDLQLRNQWVGIYTAGVRLPNRDTIFENGDFSVPITSFLTPLLHPVQTGGALDMGTIQQFYQPQWTFGGGNLALSAGRDIGRFTLFNGEMVPDSTNQLPTNYLYRRSFVDPDTGRFGAAGVTDSFRSVNDPSASTTWWIDFSNFFQGIGALGGGNIMIEAGRDIINADAVIPTNARMAGIDPVTGTNLRPDTANLLEFGGGDLVIRAGRDISGGVYYVERGTGDLFAGREVTTNQARSPTTYLLNGLNPANFDPATVQSFDPAVYDPLTWLPTTFFVGKGAFEVVAQSNVLVGAVSNPFYLPQGIGNKHWYKTWFSTFGPDAGLDVVSLGGDVTHRYEFQAPNAPVSSNALFSWLNNRQNNIVSTTSPAYFQPWIRSVETSLFDFETLLSLTAPTLRSAALGGGISLVGDTTLFPSPTGQVELLASESVVGLSPTGPARLLVPGEALERVVNTSTYGSINLSDAPESLLPSLLNPFAYVQIVGFNNADARLSGANLSPAISLFNDRYNLSINESGSFTGEFGTFDRQRRLHDASILHANDPEPVRIYGLTGDVTGFDLFSPKAAQVVAGRDLTDVSLYLQNTSGEDISIVSAGRDIIPFNESSAVRSVANDLLIGNFISDTPVSTVRFGVQTNARAGDIQISGPGVVEVLAGRNLDLGTGLPFPDGTGVGITSIGNFRNPFLPFSGANLIVASGVPGPGGSGGALGLANSSLDTAAFIEAYLPANGDLKSPYLEQFGLPTRLDQLTPEQQAIVALEVFYGELRAAGEAFVTTGGYEPGFEAIRVLFGDTARTGDIFTRTRDIRTATGGAISLIGPGGGLTFAGSIPDEIDPPPGIVTQFGGPISVFTDTSVDIGRARIFTLRGGDIVMWSSRGDIAAGSAPRTVVSAPPTRVVVDANSASIEADIGGLSTGGGIGVLASVEGVEPGDVVLIAPEGVVDAGDAGIRATGNLTIAAVAVLNASNIQVAGTTTGVPTAPVVAAPNVGGIAAAGAASAAATTSSRDGLPTGAGQGPVAEPSIVTIELIGFGGGDGE